MIPTSWSTSFRADAFIPDLYDPAHVAGCEPYYIIWIIHHTYLGLDLYYADPAKQLITAGYDLGGLDRDLSNTMT